MSTYSDRTGSRHRVVVIGSGFGGLAAVKALRSAKVNVTVTVIDRAGHHLMQPLLHQVATGALSEGEVAVPLRTILGSQHNARVLRGDVYSIDLGTRTVRFRHRSQSTTVEFDTIVVAAGSRQSYHGNEQFAEHAPGLKTLDDALELRGRILAAFEAAEVTDDVEERRRLLTFVVVGAGPTGVELAGRIMELANRTLAGTYRAIDSRDASVVLLDTAHRALSGHSEGRSEDAVEWLRAAGVTVRLGATVAADGVWVEGSAGAHTRIESRCKIWAAGVEASHLTRLLSDQTGAALDSAGRIRVDETLRVDGHVVGDIASCGPFPSATQPDLTQPHLTPPEQTLPACYARRHAAGTLCESPYSVHPRSR